MKFLLFLPALIMAGGPSKTTLSKTTITSLKRSSPEAKLTLSSFPRSSSGTNMCLKLNDDGYTQLDECPVANATKTDLAFHYTVLRSGGEKHNETVLKSLANFSTTQECNYNTISSNLTTLGVDFKNPTVNDTFPMISCSSADAILPFERDRKFIFDGEKYRAFSIFTEGTVKPSSMGDLSPFYSDVNVEKGYQKVSDILIKFIFINTKNNKGTKMISKAIKKTVIVRVKAIYNLVDLNADFQPVFTYLYNSKSYYRLGKIGTLKSISKLSPNINSSKVNHGQTVKEFPDDFKLSFEITPFERSLHRVGIFQFSRKQKEKSKLPLVMYVNVFE